MSIGVPPNWKQLWDTWNIRGFIVLSISLQVFLILFASFRKRTSNRLITVTLWSAYLLADWSAAFANGLIASSDWSSGLSTTEAKNLYSFWASFLLVHLGGPDTITSFALEDNELWLRHLLGLIFQCLASTYVFLQSLSHNELWIPTMLMFITGIMKYTERTRAFYLASSDRFRDSIIGVGDSGGNYVKLIREYVSLVKTNIPARIVKLPGKGRYAKTEKKGTLTELEVVQYGYQFFEKFKGIISNMYFSQKERSQSRHFFLNRTPHDGFKVVEVELNFIYDTFFTKLPVVYNVFGVISRFFSFATVSFGIYIFTCKKKLKFNQIDVTITYGLLYGALALEIISLIRLLLSNWTIIYLWNSPDDDINYNQSLRQQIIGVLIRYKFKTTYPKAHNFKKTYPKAHMWIRQPWTHGWPINIVKRKWSESFSTYNLIDYCCHSHGGIKQELYKGLGIDSFIESIKFVNQETFTIELRKFIYDELRFKSAEADDMETTNKIISSRGEWVLGCEGEAWSSVLHYLHHYNYDQSILIWHIATELCYNVEVSTNVNNGNEHRVFARQLSGYMMYLHIMKPSMISATTSISQIQFRDACATIKNTMQSGKLQKEKKSLLRRMFFGLGNDYDREGILREACRDIDIEISIEDFPPELIDYKNNSLLSEACILAKWFMSLQREHVREKWVIISKVWLEMLCYGAVRSRADIQISQLTKGCELITVIWLLMAHFGLSDQFESVDRDPDALLKLIVSK